MDNDYDFQTAVVVHDNFIIAALTTAKFDCSLLKDETGSLYAVFDDTPELKQALEQFKTNALQLDALELYEALIQAESVATDRWCTHVPTERA